MAGQRHYWWERYTDALNPANWLGKRVRKAVRKRTKPERRRGSREHGGGKSPRESRAPSEPPAQRESRQRPTRGDAYRDIWRQEGGTGSFTRAQRFFQGLPASYADREDELTTWRSFVANMVNGPAGQRVNDPGNPFWSRIGLSPRDFDWSGWRAVMGYGRR